MPQSCSLDRETKAIRYTSWRAAPATGHFGKPSSLRERPHDIATLANPFMQRMARSSASVQEKRNFAGPSIGIRAILAISYPLSYSRHR
jgi:hypothetical protein